MVNLCSKSSFFTLYLFLGNACRHQVNSYLRKKYKTLEDAEKDLGVDYFSDGLKYDETMAHNSRPVPLPVCAHSPNSHLKKTQVDCYGDVTGSVTNLLGSMSSKLREDFIQKLLLSHMKLEFDCEYKQFVPSDFVRLCCKAMKTLHENGKRNILYHLARGLGIEREDCSGPRLPIDRMPFGLLSYSIQYFSCDTVNNLRADPDYINWETTMYSNFGHKWACMQRGPGFAYEEKAEETVTDGSSTMSCENDVDSQCDLLTQAWDETFGSSVEMFLPENDVMDVKSNSATDANILQHLGTEILQPDENEIHLENCSLNVDNLNDSATEELGFLWARLSLEEQENVSLGDNFGINEKLHGVTPQPREPKKKIVHPLKAKINIAGPSLRTIQRHIQATPFTKDSQIQVFLISFCIQFSF